MSLLEQWKILYIIMTNKIKYKKMILLASFSGKYYEMRSLKRRKKK